VVYGAPQAAVLARRDGLLTRGGEFDDRAPVRCKELFDPTALVDGRLEPIAHRSVAFLVEGAGSNQRVRDAFETGCELDTHRLQAVPGVDRDRLSVTVEQRWQKRCLGLEISCHLGA